MTQFCISEQSVDVSKLFGQFTLDVILSAGFGVKADIQTNPDPELVQKAATVYDVPIYFYALSMLPFFRQVKKHVLISGLYLHPGSIFIRALSMSHFIRQARDWSISIEGRGGGGGGGAGVCRPRQKSEVPKTHDPPLPLHGYKIS